MQILLDDFSRERGGLVFIEQFCIQLGKEENPLPPPPQPQKKQGSSDEQCEPEASVLLTNLQLFFILYKHKLITSCKTRRKRM